MQCRVLEKHLGHAFRLVYAQDPLTGVEPGSDMTSVYKDYGPFRGWLRENRTPGDWTSRDIPAVIDAALALAMTADDAARATGDWVGLLGSQRWQLPSYSGSRGAGGPASGSPFSRILRQKSQLRCLRQRRGANPLC